MPDPTVEEPQADENPDAREAVRGVQEGHKDGGPSTGVVTDELRDA
jgi:hypothetical protein